MVRNDIEVGPSTPLRSAEDGRSLGKDRRPWLLLIAALVIALDRWTKLTVASKLAVGDAVTVIPEVFRITHVRNVGAAFSIFSESASPSLVRLGLVIFSVVAGAVVLVLLWRWGRRFSAASVGLALILGGAIGNLYDRIRLHYVVDFLEVHIVHYHWPDFNVADSAITVGACLLLLDMFFTRESRG